MHETLARIEAEGSLAKDHARRITDRRIVARTRRKALERRASSLMPEAGIDPDDTGEILLPHTG